MDRTEQLRRIRNLRAQLRRRQTACTRSTYHWPERGAPDWEALSSTIAIKVALMTEAGLRNDVQEYCRTWASLNHLKGE